ncbi:MAG: hypothetical protein JXR95_01940 [Deltaproteobacteria bacterium]|nr:hypothetical protein [Deltaproteobacteria bacterium]
MKSKFLLFLSVLLMFSCSGKNKTDKKKSSKSKPTIRSRGKGTKKDESKKGNPLLKKLIAELPAKLDPLMIPPFWKGHSGKMDLEIFYISSGHNRLTNTKCQGGGGLAAFSAVARKELKGKSNIFAFATGDTLGSRRGKGRKELVVTEKEKEAAVKILKVLSGAGIKNVFLGEGDLALGDNWLKTRAKKENIKIIGLDEKFVEFKTSKGTAVFYSVIEKRFDQKRYSENIKKWRNEKKALIALVLSGSISFAKNLSESKDSPDLIYLSGPRNMLLRKQFSKTYVFQSGGDFKYAGKTSIIIKQVPGKYLNIDSLGEYSQKLQGAITNYEKLYGVLEKLSSYPDSKKFRNFLRRTRLIQDEYNRIKKDFRQLENDLGKNINTLTNIYILLRDIEPDPKANAVLGKDGKAAACERKPEGK